MSDNAPPLSINSNVLNILASNYFKNQDFASFVRPKLLKIGMDGEGGTLFLSNKQYALIYAGG